MPVTIEGADVPTVGSDEQVDIEQVTLLRPDLIITSADYFEDIEPQLRRLSTFVQLPDRGHDGWKLALRDLAGIVDRAEKAEAAILAFEERARELRAAVPDELLTEEISLVELYPDEVGYRLRNSFPGSILAEIGLRRPPSQDRTGGPDEGTAGGASFENLDDIDADRFLVMSNADTEATLADIERNPLWERLRAVRAGQVHVVNLDHWLTGGIAQANRVLDDLRAILVDGREPERGGIDYQVAR